MEQPDWPNLALAWQAFGGHPAVGGGALVCVSIPAQRLWLRAGDGTVIAMPCSTAARGPSCVENSGGTPWGWHEVAEKHGDAAPLGAVFVGRRQVAAHWRELPPERQTANLITTRILWLRGREPGLNAGPGVDTHARYIYIHGTNHEDRLGTPSSGGCVQVANADALRLYDALPVGAPVLILRD